MTIQLMSIVTTKYNFYIINSTYFYKANLFFIPQASQLLKEE